MALSHARLDRDQGRRWMGLSDIRSLLARFNLDWHRHPRERHLRPLPAVPDHIHKAGRERRQAQGAGHVGRRSLLAFGSSTMASSSPYSSILFLQNARARALI